MMAFFAKLSTLQKVRVVSYVSMFSLFFLLTLSRHALSQLLKSESLWGVISDLVKYEGIRTLMLVLILNIASSIFLFKLSLPVIEKPNTVPSQS